MSDQDPAATPDDQTRPESSGDGQRKQLPAWVVARERRQKADKRRLLVRIGAGLAIALVLVLAHRAWRSATDDGPPRTAAQTLAAFLDAEATGDCELVGELLTDESRSQDGEPSDDEFAGHCETALIGYQPTVPALAEIRLVGDDGLYDPDGPTQGLVSVGTRLSSSFDGGGAERHGGLVLEDGEWRIETGDQITLGATIDDRVRSWVDAYNAGDCDVLRRLLAEPTWSQDGELSADEFGDRCADEVDGNADRRPLVVDDVEVSRDQSDGDSPERRIARVRLHRLGDARIEARQDRVELVREGLTWKVVGIPDTLAVTPEQLDQAGENDEIENDEDDENQDDSTPTPGGQAVGTPGSDEADASGRVVPTFEWVELQDRLVDVVDRSGLACWSYEDRGANYPTSVPPMIGIEREFGACAGEVRVAVRAFPDDTEAQDAAEHLVNRAVTDDAAVRTQVPGLDGAVGATLRCAAPPCAPRATAHAVQDGLLVSVDVDSEGGNGGGTDHADMAAAAGILRSQLEQL